MANTNGEDLLNKNLNKPLIRTMEDDLKVLRETPSSRGHLPVIESSKVPKNLPINPAPAPKYQPKPAYRPEPEMRRATPEEEAYTPPPIMSGPIGVKPAEAEPGTKTQAIPASAPRQEEAKIAPAQKLTPTKLSSKPASQPSRPFAVSKASEQPAVGTLSSERGVTSKQSEPAVKKAPKPVFAFPSKPQRAIPPIQTPAFSPRPPVDRPATAPQRPRRQTYGLDSEYSNLTPEMRIARQGPSSFSIDLEIGMKRDAQGLQKAPVSARGNLPPSGSPHSSVPESNGYVMPSNPGSEIMRQRAEVGKGGGLVSAVKIILKYLALALLVAGLGFGVYYFFEMKNKPISVVEPDARALVPDLDQFQIKMDINRDVIPGIKNYFKDNAEETAGVSRIMVRDSTDSFPLKIENFNTALRVNIPPNFTSNLDGDYNLIAFNYPQNNYSRLGLVFKLKNVNLAYNLTENWEPTMFKDMGALFLDLSEPIDDSNKFGSNIYRGVNIRYLPLGKNGLALNYAIDATSNLFFIATSKDDVYYLIDKIEE